VFVVLIVYGGAKVCWRLPGRALGDGGPKTDRAALVHRDPGACDGQQAEGYAQHQHTADGGMCGGGLELQALEVRIEPHQADLPFAAQRPKETQDDHGSNAVSEPGMGGIDFTGKVSRDSEAGEQRMIEAHAIHDVQHGELECDDASGEDAWTGIGLHGPVSIRSFPCAPAFVPLVALLRADGRQLPASIEGQFKDMEFFPGS
jgi:hypothetical protein